MKKVFVFIDGSNFYHRIKSIAQYFTKETGQEFSISKFNFKGFCQSLVGDENNLLEIHYYIGQVKRPNPNAKNNQKAQQLYDNQQRLTRYLQNENITVRFGKLIKSAGSYHEKGVDVQIAVEMIRFARQDKYNVAYLVSSDTDLVPAVEEVKDLGKEVVYVGVKRIPEKTDKKDAFGLSFGLLKAANDIKIVEKEQIKLFLAQKDISKFQTP